MLSGHQTWIFEHQPTIISSGTIGGPFEANGNIAHAFDILHDDMWLNQDSFEKSQQTMLEEACQMAIKKSDINKEQVNFFIGGDLINQITPTTFAANTMRIPYLVLYSACSKSMVSLSLFTFLLIDLHGIYIINWIAIHILLITT